MSAEADLALLRRMADAVALVVKEAAPEGFGKILRMGADGTATKMVDDLAEQVIIQMLEAERPGLDLLSEEAGLLDLGGERLLVADPIDGTTNAVRGIPFYCVSLAIGKRDLSDVEAGLVLNLCTGERYEAVRGGGAWRNGRPIKVSTERKNLVFAIGSARGGPDHPYPTQGIVRSFGASALEMCLVAQGALDGYQYSKPILRIIDIAASTLIVREAGGIVLDHEGKDLELPLSLTPRFTLTTASSREVAALMGGSA